MPRKKLSEYRSKKIIYKIINTPYSGWSVSTAKPLSEQIDTIPDGIDAFVVKVDQGIKGRFKKGLVLLDVKQDNLEQAVESLSEKGYEHFIMEPQVSHSNDEERYLSISYQRAGTTLSYTKHGGIHVESHADTMLHVPLDAATNWQELAAETGFTEWQLQDMWRAFQDTYMTLLEINPYIVTNDTVQVLDTAIEVDDAGAFYTGDTWSEDDFRRATSRQLTEEEQTVITLGEKSPASFKLEVINPSGSVFVLLSGGGASIVAADEVYAAGQGKELANYGEYSGNPNTEEAYIYTKAVLSLLRKSTASQKVLIIGGAVANFTDIANTFTGVIQAIDEVANELQQQGVKVFVRRGGPRQEIGLAKIEAALKKHNLLGAVHSPKTPLPAVIYEALEEIQ